MNVSNGKTLTRYPLTVQQVARPESVEMLNFGLHQVTVNGTAKAVQGVLPSWKDVAGKTGTTNDKKDSWFAGFSGQHVMTVWVGRDDSKPTNMTGGTGALKVWADMMKVMPSQPLKIGQSSRLIWVDVDSATGLLFNPACGKSVKMPFVRGSQPQKMSYCAAPQLEAPASETGAPAPAPAPGTQVRPVAPAPAQAAPRPAAPRPAPAPAAEPRGGSWVDDLMNKPGN
jgi:penicillin-binding protein 1B